VNGAATVMTSAAAVSDGKKGAAAEKMRTVWAAKRRLSLMRRHSDEAGLAYQARVGILLGRGTYRADQGVSWRFA